MNAPEPQDRQGIWAPPAPSTGRVVRRWQRTLSIGAVIALHIVLVVYLAARPLGWRLPGLDSAENPNVAWLDSTVTADSAGAIAGQDLNPADLLESEAARRPRGDFVPPRLVRKSVTDVSSFARRAGIESGESARVILAVEVTEQGAPGDVRVSTSSGNAQADTLAIEYARTLRWDPANEHGRTSRASIRLPVILAVSD